MKSTCVKFESLEDLVQFKNRVKKESYSIDSNAFTLKAMLNEFEIVIAIEQYSALVLQQTNQKPDQRKPSLRISYLHTQLSISLKWSALNQ